MTVKPAEQTAKSEPTPKAGLCVTPRAFLLLRRSDASSSFIFSAFGVIAVSMIVAALMVGVVIVPAASASEGCENEARRVEQGSTLLPDCRAYELVSLPSQPGPYYNPYFGGRPALQTVDLTGSGSTAAEPISMPETQSGVSIADDGDAVLFTSFNEPNAESNTSASNLSRRGPAGWSGENIVPPTSRRGFLCDQSGYVGFSANLEEVAVAIGEAGNEGGVPDADAAEDCGHPEPPIAPGESEETSNLFLRDTATGSFQLVNVTPPETKSYNPHFVGISSDGSHVFFVSRAELSASADAENGKALDTSVTAGHCPNTVGNLYVWSAGAVHLATVLPGGTSVRGTLASSLPQSCGGEILPPRNASFTHSISADGERILFNANDGGLYLREHPAAEQSALDGSGECTESEKACTIQIDLPEGVSGSGGGGQFQWANAEATKIFFTAEEKLTPDSTAVAGMPDLYEYDLEKPVGQRLADLTVNAAEPADVLGVSGASQDGSYVYFVAHADLTGAQQNSQGKAALGPAKGSGTLTGGMAANLYMRYAGSTTFIATLSEEGGIGATGPRLVLLPESLRTAPSSPSTRLTA